MCLQVFCPYSPIHSPVAYTQIASWLSKMEGWHGRYLSELQLLKDSFRFGPPCWWYRWVNLVAIFRGTSMSLTSGLKPTGNISQLYSFNLWFIYIYIYIFFLSILSNQSSNVRGMFLLANYVSFHQLLLHATSATSSSSKVVRRGSKIRQAWQWGSRVGIWLLVQINTWSENYYK